MNITLGDLLDLYDGDTRVLIYDYYDDIKLYGGTMNEIPYKYDNCPIISLRPDGSREVIDIDTSGVDTSNIYKD